MTFYAVAKGHNIGIYNFWNDCKEQILGFKGAVYKKFNNEKDAEEYILNITSITSDLFENIYNRFNIEEVEYFVYTDGSCYNNGDINSVSGIGIFFGINNKKNVLGMMPHPERMIDKYLSGEDGSLFFENLIGNLK